MFKVDVNSLDAYFDFDPARKKELVGLDRLIQSSAPGLKRYFHEGTPAGEPGMRFKMIGYGPFHYASKSGKMVMWPAIGIALQKNYVSVYLALNKNGEPLLASYVGTLGELRSGVNNFSFECFDALNHEALSSLFAEADLIFAADHNNPIRTTQGQ